MAAEIHARGAYGRTYTSAAAVRADWNAGKDFQDAISGRYLNLDTAQEMHLVVWIRYANDRKLVQVYNGYNSI